MVQYMMCWLCAAPLAGAGEACHWAGRRVVQVMQQGGNSIVRVYGELQDHLHRAGMHVLCMVVVFCHLVVLVAVCVSA